MCRALRRPQMAPQKNCAGDAYAGRLDGLKQVYAFFFFFLFVSFLTRADLTVLFRAGVETVPGQPREPSAGRHQVGAGELEQTLEEPGELVRGRRRR